MNPGQLPNVFGRTVTRVHCLGVGGMGVGPLAIYLSGLGFSVTGEDDALSEEMSAQLVNAGVRLSALPSDCELVVHSSAVPETHPVRVAARQRGVPLVRRGEMLAEVLRDKRLVAVCGSHGKTTTTAMLITVLRTSGFPAGYVLGGLFADGSAPAQVGANDWVVAEIDESDRTIDRFSPEITLAVNLDWDHPDQYRERADLEGTFAALFGRTRGTVLISSGCESSRQITAPASGTQQGIGARVATFGPGAEFAFRIATETATRMELQLGGAFALPVATVRARGDFNAANAAAALAAAQLMGAGVSATALAEFPGVRRRQAILHDRGGLTVLEDYAHHPGEICALLASLRERVGPTQAVARGAGGRLLVVFQPHRYSRTAQFKREFAEALAKADQLFLLDVYGAGEAPLSGGTTADVLAEIRSLAPELPVCYQAGDDEAVLLTLDREVRPRDLVAFVGAGDIDRKARTWLEERGGGGARWDEFIPRVRPLLSAETLLEREEPLASKTTMRVGGAARLYAEPAGIPDLQALLQAATSQRIAVYLLGRGSNLLVPDDGVDGLVIALAQPAWSTFELRPGGRVWAGAGLRLKNLCGLAAKAGLSGFEFLEGIPGSVGGALRMNAGAMGGWMFDIVEELQLMTIDGRVQAIPRAALQVTYRRCPELEQAIALGALLRPVAHADADSVNRQIALYRRKRQDSQPREPSAGCIFKNPPDNSAGRLIDECGLKGERVGDAEVSPVHANFIINRGHATATDVLTLVRRVRARVQEIKGIELEPEVLLYGKEWKDVL